MAISDKAQLPLVGVSPEVAGRRKIDPVFDEICRDFETLAELVDPPDENPNHQISNLQWDLKVTLNALQDEIRDRLKRPIS